MNNKLFAGVLALTLSAAAQAVPVSAWEVTNPSGFRNASWSFGDIFTVGANSITVTALGAIDIGLNGFATTAGIPVGIFRESDDMLLVSTVVTGSNALIGNYRFADIPDLVLQANTTYRVVAVNRDDQYNIATSTPSVVDSRITWNSYGYCQTTALTSCDVFTGNERTWMANMQIDDGRDGVIPEPGSLLLAGLALAGLGAARRRNTAK